MTNAFDVLRHERYVNPVELGERLRDEVGKFRPMLPAFERAKRDAPPYLPMHELCECGRRRGLHRWGDEACPNPNWRPGNGSAQFVARSFTRP